MKIEDFYKDFISRDSICVEVGVWRGYNAEEILKSNPKKLYLVDPWVNQSQELEEKEVIVHSHVGAHQNEQEEWFNEVKQKFHKNSSVEIIRDYSVNAAKLFDNDFFDFIYIDGLHNYESVRDDINAWSKKIKPFDGVICLDDYEACEGRGYGFIEAADEFLSASKNFSIYKQTGRRLIIKKT